MLNFHPFKNQIGLDISDFKIRFMQFHKKRNGKYIINSFGEIPVSPGLISGGKILNYKVVLKLLNNLLEKPSFGKIDSSYINASLPEKKIYVKTVTIPNVPKNELKGAVTWGIEQNIPITLNEVYYDWQILNHSNKNSNKQIQVLVSVAPKKIVDVYTELINNTNFTLIGLENESVAITRCLIDQRQKIQTTLLIIDLGKSRTNLIIYGNNAVKFNSTLNINGSQMTEIISKSVKLSIDDAEKAKIICGLDGRKGRGSIKKILLPIMNQLVTKINDNLNYYNNYVSDTDKINSILLTGSVSKMRGLTDFLRENLKCNAIIGDPWTNMSFTKGNKTKWKHNFYSFTTAIGLAQKQFE